jgi:hypothetical protein
MLCLIRQSKAKFVTNISIIFRIHSGLNLLYCLYSFCETERFAHIPIWKEGSAAMWAGLELEHVLLPYCIEALRQPNIAYKSKKVSRCRLCFFLELFTEYTECQAFCASLPNWDPPQVSVIPPPPRIQRGEEQLSLAGWGEGWPNSDD